MDTFYVNCCILVNNLKSVENFADILFEKIGKRLMKVGCKFPLDPHLFLILGFLLWALSLRQKKNSFRLIHHLSFPEGQSRNDQIDDILVLVTSKKLRCLGKISQGEG